MKLLPKTKRQMIKLEEVRNSSGDGLLRRVSFQKSKEDIESIGLSITRMLLRPDQRGRQNCERGNCAGLSDLGLGKEYAEKARLIMC